MVAAMTTDVQLSFNAPETHSPFITFEGLDKCGKSSQVRLLADRMAALSYPLAVIREPGGTPYAERVRKLIMQDKSESLNTISNAMMFSAARADVTKEVIIPSLEAEAVVLSDRYVHSTFAYQHYGNGLSWSDTWELCRMSSYGLIPSLVIYIEIPFTTMLQRRITDVSANGNLRDYESDNFFRRVRRGYNKMFGVAQPIWADAVAIFDGRMSPNDLHDAIWERVQLIL